MTKINYFGYPTKKFGVRTDIANVVGQIIGPPPVKPANNLYVGRSNTEPWRHGVPERFVFTPVS
jgi:hypothetical protein